MSTEAQLDALGYGLWFFVLILPPLIVVFATRISQLRPRFLRFCLGVFIPWISLECYHSVFIRPLSFRLAGERGDDLYDGTGAGAAVFIVGLVLPTVTALLTLGTQAIVFHYRSRSPTA